MGGEAIRPRRRPVQFCPRANDFKPLGAKNCPFRGSTAPIPDIVRAGFRAHTISGREISLFKPLRRHFRVLWLSGWRRWSGIFENALWRGLDA